MHHFPKKSQFKISEYKKLGNRQKISLSNSREVYVRFEGCELRDVRGLLDDLTLQGSVPEPLRVAQLLAYVLLKDKNYKNF